MSPAKWLDVSQPQDTQAGSLLGRMWYGNFIQNLLRDGEYSGYPHNGGQHTLRLNLNLWDMAAFLKLVEEIFPKHPGTGEFVSEVKRRWSKKP